MRGPPYTEFEEGVVRRYYPEGGAAACRPWMRARSLRAISWYANTIGVRLTPAAFAASRRNGGAATRKPKPAKTKTKTKAAYQYAKPSADAANAKAGRRRCLSCRDDFASEGMHNRICKRCRELHRKRTLAPTYSDDSSGYVRPRRGSP